jgi:hypothetical protein
VIAGVITDQLILGTKSHRAGTAQARNIFESGYSGWLVSPQARFGNANHGLPGSLPACFPCLFSMPCGQVAVAVANATMPQLEERLMEEAQRQNEAVEMAREAAMLEVQPS